MIGIAIALMSLMPPMEAAQPKCGELIDGCLRYQLPYGFVCDETPSYGCINGPCKFPAGCPEPVPPKPKPRPEPLVASKGER